MAKISMNLENVKEEGGSRYSKVPAGIYPATVESVEVKPTSGGTGHFLEVAILITEGDHAGKLLVDRVNIDNPSAKALEIGLARLKKIGICAGVKNPNHIEDTDELLTGKVFKIETHLVVQKSKENDKEFEMTEIKKYVPSDEEVSAPAAKPSTPAAKTSGKKPWDK